MFKRYCKLIFTTLVIALAFTAFSLSAFAQIPFMPDPISGAMAGNMAASGFAISGVSGLSPDSASSLFGSNSDPVPWDSISHKSAKISEKDSSTYSVELSPSISTAGERRTEYINQAYNLAPGTVHSFGTLYAYGTYLFSHQRDSSNWFGSSLGNPLTSSTYYVDNSAYISITRQSPDSTNINYTAVVGNASESSSRYIVPSRDQVVFGIATSFNPPRFGFFSRNSNDPYTGSYGNISSLFDPGQVTLTSYTPSISRDNDSVIVDPAGRKNVINIPKSYLNQITFIEDTDITDDNTLKEILTQIFTAFMDDAIESSDYEDPGPIPPTPGQDTVADTLWTDFQDFFQESFGDIYDGLHSFQESFGDWVDDVASGWTEVFGDIYDDIHAFKESFGDWVDTASAAITSTLSSILSTLQSLAQTIENADFQFIDAFWKNFLTPFNSLFNTIKSHLSIWHYVVEWLASISSVFTFYLGVFSGAGSGFLLPIYACFAGTVVIAVYKRFGK